METVNVCTRELDNRKTFSPHGVVELVGGGEWMTKGPIGHLPARATVIGESAVSRAASIGAAMVVNHLIHPIPEGRKNGALAFVCHGLTPPAQQEGRR
jgi:hypothetical protein